MPMTFVSPDKYEENIVRQTDAYQYLCDLVKRIIELDNQELKKQMGKDWDDGLADIEPYVDAVIDTLSFNINLEILVEEVFWSAQGNLIASSLPDEL